MPALLQAWLQKTMQTRNAGIRIGLGAGAGVLVLLIAAIVVPETARPGETTQGGSGACDRGSRSRGTGETSWPSPAEPANSVSKADSRRQAAEQARL